MKRLFLLTAVLFSAIAFSQVKFGVKGGADFGYNGSLKSTIRGIKESKGSNNVGWHLGAFGRLTLVSWYIQPELYYSSIKTNFNNTDQGNFSSTSNRLDIPVLVGKKFLEIFRVNAGPVFSASLKEKVSLSDIKKLKSDDFALAGQVGAGVDLGSFTIDARYEFGFNDSQAKFIRNNTNEEFKIEKRPSTLLLSVGYTF